MAETVAQPNTSKNKVRSWIIKILVIILLIISFLIYWKYYNAYSNGDRIGKDLKISTRGNIFKTCEGYFTEGCRDVVSNPVTFSFSVSDEEVEKKLLQYQLDPNACVKLTYVEYRNTLFWRGDSKYIIIAAEELSK
jgi:hypothetical protein